jgi:shikimate dehydrogenase
MIDNIKKTFWIAGSQYCYSFSKGYFTDKFKTENIEGCTYENFDIADISEFPSVIENTPDIKGINVTIPYKEEVIAHLYSLSKATLSAVNTIKLQKGKLKVTILIIMVLKIITTTFSTAPPKSFNFRNRWRF